jgi:hypothetical protein
MVNEPKRDGGVFERNNIRSDESGENDTVVVGPAIGEQARNDAITIIAAGTAKTLPYGESAHAVGPGWQESVQRACRPGWLSWAVLMLDLGGLFS